MEPDDDESIEERVETIEAEIGETEFGKIEARIDVIEIEQEQLREDLDTVVESFREQGDEIPHIETIQELHTRLEGVEQNVAALRLSLEEFVDRRE